MVWCDNSNRREYAVWFAWVVACVFVVGRHEMWFDELQPWAIVRHARSIPQLMDNIRWEGHPPLWYLVLWPISRVTAWQGAVQFVNVVFCSATVLLVLRYMPVALSVRVGIVFGYVPMYELGVISRSYGLMSLLGVSAMVLAQRKRTTYLAVLLAIAMAATVVQATPLALALIATFLMREKTEKWSRVRLGAAVGAAMVSVTVLVLALLPRGGGPIRKPRWPTFSSIESTLSLVARVLVPIPRLRTEFWNTSVLDPMGPVVLSLVGLSLIVLLSVAMCDSRRALVVWILGSVSFVGARLIFIAEPGIRHVTSLWLALVLALWYSAIDSAAKGGYETGKRGPWSARLVAALLIVGVGGSVVAVAQDVRLEFSGGEKAAEWISRNAETPYVVLCGTDPWMCASVGIRLDAAMYRNSRDTPFTFVRFTLGWRHGVATPDRIMGEARILAMRTGRRVVIVTVRGALPSDCAGEFSTIRSVIEPFGVCIVP